MAHVQHVSVASDRVMAALIAGLECEFGRGAGEALAGRFLAAEESDFCWEARVSERWLGFFGRHEGEEDLELDRVQIIGFLDGQWFVATVIVDGDGNTHGMTGRRVFKRESQARTAFADV